MTAFVNKVLLIYSWLYVINSETSSHLFYFDCTSCVSLTFLLHNIKPYLFLLSSLILMLCRCQNLTVLQMILVTGDLSIRVSHGADGSAGAIT